MKFGRVIARIVHIVAYIPLFALGLTAYASRLLSEGLCLVFCTVCDTLTDWSGWL